MTKNPPPRWLQHRNGRKEGHMRFYKGLWWYKGQSYPTLHDALVSVWPKPSKKAS